jgi:hypothetical protein
MEDALEIFVADIGEVPFLIDTGVVHQDVDAAIAVIDLLYQAGKGGEVVQVLADGLAQRAQLRGSGIQFFPVAANDHCQYLVLYEPFCDGESDASSSSCDDSYFVCMGGLHE